MKKFLKATFILSITCLIVILIFTIIFINNTITEINLTNLNIKSLDSKTPSNLVMYDINGNPLSALPKKICLSQLQDYTKNAFISIEDKDFYKHNGINYKRIIKALINNIKSKSFKEGASTISQQLIKNTQLSNEKTIERKIKEFYMTQELEKDYSKEQILELYLNNIYFGNSSYGIAEASKNYFNKSASDLSISESAILAGIIKSPATYSPIYNKETCIKRRNIVLKEMLKDSYITEEEYDNAILEDISLHNSKENIYINTNYDYCEKAIFEASQILDINITDIIKEDYKIYTYLDPTIQNKVFEIINQDYYKIKNSLNNCCQGILTVIDNTNNQVVAFASNTDYDVTNLKRQPGSAIKPILVYAPALEEKLITPSTKILDEPIDINGYKPQNLGNNYRGYTSIRDCVSYSLNIPAVKLLDQLGINKAKDYAEKFGIDLTEQDNGLSIALGGFNEGITIDKLTNAYSVFANNGYYQPSTFVKEIKNKHGITIYKDTNYRDKIINEDSAYLMTSILQDGVKYGTSRRLSTLNYDIAGKTGTVASQNNSNSDAVSIAYTTDYSVGCWLGNYTMNPENDLESSNNGGTYATSAIKETFDYLTANKQPNKFTIPNNITQCKINNIIYENENKLVVANDSCEDRYTFTEYFSIDNLPPEDKTSDNYVCNLALLDTDITSISLQINTNKYYNYTLIRIQDDQEIIVREIDGSTRTEIIHDTNLSPNTTYQYYIKYSQKGSTKPQISKVISAVTKSIKQPNEYNIIDYEWLFS